jgi:hypothetical protein
MMPASPLPPCSPNSVAKASRLRTGGLVLVAAGALGTAAELLLIEHWHDWWQYIPLVLCALLCASSAICLVRPGRVATRIARGVALLAVTGACVGVGQHLWANGTFTAEIRPSYTLFQLIVPAFTGASPTLAPGALGLLAAWLWLVAPSVAEH